MEDEIKKLSNLVQIQGGGQKEVFIADHQEFGKVVYKKIFPKDDSLERTKREVRAVSLLGSDNIPTIYSHNCDEDSPNPLWLIEKFILGSNLRNFKEWKKIQYC